MHPEFVVIIEPSEEMIMHSEKLAAIAHITIEEATRQAIRGQLLSADLWQSKVSVKDRKEE